MGIFSKKMREPVFLKESSNAEVQLAKLRQIEPLLNEEGKSRIRYDMKCLENGIAGEKNIAFELKNSHMPMYILHDVFLKAGDLSAQIDYLVFTKKLCFVLESKNLYGNIEINNTGSFIRTTEFNGKRKKEGIYSPLTQNQRHLELMKMIRIESKGNFLTRGMEEKNFDQWNMSMVVLANPKTILDAKYAKKEVKEKVIRIDQLVDKIREIYDMSSNTPVSDEKMEEWAKFYLNLHTENEMDYCKKYEQYKLETNQNVNVSEEVAVTSEPLVKEESEKENNVPVEETELFKELKAYRLQKSREEKMKPYYLYNDNQLRELIRKMPKDRQELIQVPGFGEIKADKYGEDIIGIIAKYK